MRDAKKETRQIARMTKRLQNASGSLIGQTNPQCVLPSAWGHVIVMPPREIQKKTGSGTGAGHTLAVEFSFRYLPARISR
jgi:hypothetical protein